MPGWNQVHHSISNIIEVFQNILCDDRSILCGNCRSAFHSFMFSVDSPFYGNGLVISRMRISITWVSIWGRSNNNYDNYNKNHLSINMGDVQPVANTLNVHWRQLRTRADLRRKQVFVLLLLRFYLEKVLSPSLPKWVYMTKLITNSNQAHYCQGFSSLLLAV